MTPATIDKALLSNLVLKGDLTGLTNEQKVDYYGKFCERLGLDPLTQPFKILRLQDKEVLYCDRSGAQQLNKLHGVSHEVKSREKMEGLYVVTCRASIPDGRFTESIGTVSLTYPDFIWVKEDGRNKKVPHHKAGKQLEGDDFANAIMKAETKAKRRATLDLLGLGILDETETETIPNAVTVDAIPDSIFQKSADDLKHEYLELLTQLETVIGSVPTKMLPDNWKKEQTVENFNKAIEAVKKQLNEERALRKPVQEVHKMDDINERVAEAVARDDYHEQRNGK